MYESCKSSVFIATNTTIGEEFPNGQLFCDRMFIDTELFVGVLPDTDKNCFDPLTRGPLSLLSRRHCYFKLHR